MENLQLQNFYLGGSLTVLSRCLKIVDFGDEFTKKHLVKNLERFLCFYLLFFVRCVFLIRPNGIFKTGLILNNIENIGLRIINLKMILINKNEFEEIFDKKMNQINFG